MKKIFFSSLFALVLSSVMLNSCKKAEVDNDTQSAIDNGICEQEFVKVTPTVNGKAVNERGVQKMFSGSCPDIYIDPADSADGFPVTMWMFYDTTGSGCQDIDGEIRKGTVKVEFSKPWHKDTLGTGLATITFIDYAVNGITYEGTVIISKPAQHAFRTQVINGKCTKAGSWDLFWDCDRTVTWVAGQNDSLETNDVFEITGTANGVNRNGKSYTANITSTLVKAASCTWIQQGILDITPEGRPTRSLDYGNGTCDNKATVTINGNTYNLTLN